jgi:hypothetical protein
MTPTHVYDSEELYRSVRSDEYKTINGRVIFSASAFNDRDRKPSVDRSGMRKDPKDARKSPTDGITKLIAREIRGTCKISIFDKKGKVTGQHAVDVLHRPIVDSPGEADNLAHCQIECHPTIENDGSFKRLKEALAVMATRIGFVVEPDPLVTAK